MSRLFDELKRRNVLRMAALYAAAAWLLMQVVGQLLEIFELPLTYGQVLAALLAIGFPIALLLSWFYELTPGGISLEQGDVPGESVTRITGRRMDFVVIALLAAALILFAYDKWRPQALVEKSIAVLPFELRSSSPEDAHFGDGMHDDIITLLYKVRSLGTVISRTTMERYRDSELSIPEIAAELGVTMVLESGVQRSGDRVRINVQLIDGATDKHLWGETFDRKLTMKNIFIVQTEIVTEIVTRMHVAMSDEDTERLRRMPTPSLEAYDEYKLGWQEAARRSGDSLRRAQAHFENATALDPDYVLAYVGLADSLRLQIAYAGMDRQTARSLSLEAAEKALALDPLSGEAHTTMAGLKHSRGNIEAAEKQYLLALKLSPNYANAHHWYSRLLSRSFRHDEALKHMIKSIELDPSAQNYKQNLASEYRLLGRVDNARATILESIHQRPDFGGHYASMARLEEEQENLGEATRWMRKALQLMPSNAGLRNFQCINYLQLGDHMATEDCVEAAEQAFPDATLSSRLFLHVFRSEHELAMQWAKNRELEGPGSQWTNLQAYIYVHMGRYDEAISIYAENFPQLFDERKVANEADVVGDAGIVAATLYLGGQQDHANILFDQVLDKLPEHETLSNYGSFYVLIHAVRGEKQQAIAALREAIDAGKRRFWWELRGPFFDAVRADPEWMALVAELDAHIARQRQWYEEHKDDPLFGSEGL